MFSVIRSESSPIPKSRRLLAAVVGVGVLFAISSAPADAAKKSTRKVTKKSTKAAAPATEAPTVATEAPTAPPTTVAAKPLFAVGKSQLGSILVSNNGLTLYNFDPDAKKPGGSACNGPCADVWPPLIVKSEADLVAPEGFTGKLSTVKRDDGSLQAAANSEVWWVLDPTGNVVRTAPTIRFRGNKLGAATTATQMMVGTSGRTVYMYEPDKKIGVPTCYDQCAIAWPPLLVSSKDDLKLLQGQNVDPSKVTVFPRADTNQLQVAYDGWPLYYWFRDNKPGDTTGQAVGNVWWVIDTTGKPMKN
jgi:predicted lipoprotein with Yx(FWY)xxD motif